MNIDDVKRQLPKTLQHLIDDYDWHPASEGESDAAVFHLVGNTTSYLKVSQVDAQFPVKTDKTKLDWLNGKIAVPKVLAYEESTTHQYLLMSAIEGLFPFHDNLDWTVEERIICLAQAARAFHSIPIDDCPFKWGTEEQLAGVRENIGLNRVAVDMWEDEHHGKTIEQLYRELLAAHPTNEDLVLVHGDMYPLNIHVNPSTKQVNGYIDVGACGIGDRYTDLALIAQAIGWHFDAKYIDFFFEQYGIPKDAQKIYFYQLMTEFY